MLWGMLFVACWACMEAFTGLPCQCYGPGARVIPAKCLPLHEGFKHLSGGTRRVERGNIGQCVEHIQESQFVFLLRLDCYLGLFVPSVSLFPLWPPFPLLEWIKLRCTLSASVHSPVHTIQHDILNCALVQTNASGINTKQSSLLHFLDSSCNIIYWWQWHTQHDSTNDNSFFLFPVLHW